jgi:hypothetical protein
MARIHAREPRVTSVENEIRRAVTAIVYDEDRDIELTDGEIVRVVSGALGGFLQVHAKQMIREERHPENPDKPGGLA